jgi:hypothetical protein
MHEGGASASKGRHRISGATAAFENQPAMTGAPQRLLRRHVVCLGNAFSNRQAIDADPLNPACGGMHDRAGAEMWNG